MKFPRIVACVAVAVSLAIQGISAGGDLDGWLASRAERVRALPADAAPAAMREDLGELRRILVRDGMDEDLAAALTALPEDLLLTDSRNRASAALEIVRKRLRRFEEASLRRWPPAPEGARERFETILEGEEFNLQPDEQASAADLMSRIRAWIGAMLTNMFNAIAARPALVRTIAYAFLAALALALGWLIVRLWTAGRAARTRPAAVSHRPMRRERDPREVLDLAQALARDGRWRQALGTAQAAVILALKRRGALPDLPSLTDLEGVDALRPDVPPDVRARFERLVAMHDRAVYGGDAPAEDSVSEAIALGSSLVHPDPAPTETS